jgi:16S rRNA (cytidine1402-2'-O)-methyltransferase
MPTGTLYLVSTPIGNLEDITYRALRILREVDLIAAEDTRHTRKLLAHYDIHTRFTSYYEFKETGKAAKLVTRLLEGASIALVSNAGTPGISDPGYRLVSAAIDAGVHVVPVPGPDALTAALVASGLSPARFCFEGFLPRKRSQRKARLEAIRSDPRTYILYEAPNRVATLLSEIAELFPARKVVVARELTKIHEEIVRGSAEELAELFHTKTPKGEFVVLVQGGSDGETPAPDDSMVLETFTKLVEQEGLSRSDAIKETAKRLGLPKRDVYRLVSRSFP